MSGTATVERPTGQAVEKAPPVLIARDIVKELGRGAAMVRALKGVSLELYPGELTLLMGPSGSGKTTLLSILGCILAPTSGTLSIAGQDTEGMKPEHAGVVDENESLRLVKSLR